MKAENSSSVPEDMFVVHTVTQAKLLTNPEAVKFFKPFLAADKTMSDVAQELGCSISTLHYRVKQFINAGLLIVVREKARAGRAVKVYRSVKDRVFVPFSLTPYATLEESFSEQLRPVWQEIESQLAKCHAHNVTQGRKLVRDEHGVVLTTLNASLTDDDSETTEEDNFYSDVSLLLTKQQAISVAETLRTLMHEMYQANQQRQRDDLNMYMFQTAFVPVT